MCFEFSHTHVLKMAEAVNFSICGNAGEDTMRRGGCLCVVDVFGRQKRCAFDAELFDASAMLWIKIYQDRRMREHKRFELMHLNVGKEIGLAYVCLPSLLNMFGSLIACQALRYRFFVTGKSFWERV